MKTFRGILALAALATGGAFGGTIVSESFGGTTGSHGGSYVVDWTQTGTYTNVSIGVLIAADNGNSTATGTAYLVTAIGSAANASDEVVAPAAVSVSDNPGTLTTIFTGLTLGPGTYYLVIDPSSTNQTNSLDWDFSSLGVQTLDSGVTQGSDDSLPGAYNSSPVTPVATRQSFTVTGTLESTGPTTPEPMTLVTTLGGLAGLFLARRKMTRIN